MMYPNTTEFRKWYSLLMESAPTNYIPFLFPLNIGGKDPLSTRGSWIADKNCLSFEEAIRFMTFRYNVGIASLSTDELILVDVDDETIISKSDVKPTLSVTTRSRVGAHYYYFSNEVECICNLPTEFGEIRSCNQFLVAPGSYVHTDPSTVPERQREFSGYYILCNPIPPVSITFSEFPKVFRDHAYLINHVTTIQKREPSEFRSKSMLFDLTINDVISYPKNKYRFPSPFHDTKSGANASSDGKLIQCWRHLVTHNALQALSVVAGIYSCQEAGVSHTNGGSGPSMLNLNDGHTLYTIWRYAISEGYIPKDDQIPRVALNWFATEAGICKESDITDGWKLPSWAYSEAMRLLRTIP